jgi:minor curlin subunit
MERNVKSGTDRYLETVKVKLSSFFTLTLVVFTLVSSEMSHSLGFESDKGYIYIGKWYFSGASKPAKRGEFGEGISTGDVSDYFGITTDSVRDISPDMDMFGSDLNHAEIDLNDSTFSIALIAQEGDGNYADIYVKGHRNYAIVQQLGYDNLALLAQVGNRNIAKILQDGVNNTAMILQLGNKNRAKIVQMGSDNRVSILQEGNKHKAFIVAGSGSDVGISQTSSVQSNTMIIKTANSMSIKVRN